MSCFLCNQLKGLTPWEVLSWHRPTATGSLFAVLLSTILFFWYMKYTVVTFLCRLLQVLFAAMPLMGFMKWGTYTNDDIQMMVDRFADCFAPYAVLVLQKIYDLVTWRDRKQSGAIAALTVVLAIVGNYFSDMAVLGLIVTLLFTAPVVYEKNKEVIDNATADIMAMAEEHLGALRTKVDQLTKKNN
ncbi:reticulon domain protein [Trypanosoma equiperdum]|uniref:Reticulon-like protein n=4 Tax=Trypanozoon TaxID=39700 RepID=Q585Y2_TRYB2|nr:reticulon domain protein, putative [Trypanosoma brucei gambiense DAL972]XP_845502.1 reticulon domain protein [Trypanosoma brucei brucei TREU927]AAX80747.1 reticulon domain protein [Trypanosoma brucei]RHW72215.1 reticulon domain protein [Trypanosoma brucei equiperdum]SCU68117.1 reticulon domain protein [Trypanosoma equiperdum]AAZ11943.1 reticulon domain protein [Trypanosoma brucei brucei TREU927]CBH11884.1 reticulon domain protein, putative [Trypanosoma brucei gambiense DAL972]|eukprot:XP_011774169.1 reticulon domain protein, putative [Trypanosoma brucei gambiense DAL972]